MNYYFTADTHFGHTNIIKYCNRPFKTVEQMDETIINNWNKIVKPNDVIYHLGDFCFKNKLGAKYYLDKLNGFKYFLWGNHDKALIQFWKKEYNYKYFQSFKVFGSSMGEIKIKEQNIILNHYAMRVWDKSHYGSWHLYGHSHGNLPDDPHSLSLDVGVDCHNFTPISFDEIKTIMSKKLFIPIDRTKRKHGGGIGLDRNAFAKEERKRQYEMLKKEFNDITDGFGNFWSKTCPMCNNDSMEIVRPGKVQCHKCG